MIRRGGLLDKFRRKAAMEFIADPASEVFLFKDILDYVGGIVAMTGSRETIQTVMDELEIENKLEVCREGRGKSNEYVYHSRVHLQKEARDVLEMRHTFLEEVVKLYLDDPPKRFTENEVWDFAKALVREVTMDDVLRLLNYFEKEGKIRKRVITYWELASVT